MKYNELKIEPLSMYEKCPIGEKRIAKEDSHVNEHKLTTGSIMAIFDLSPTLDTTNAI